MAHEVTHWKKKRNLKIFQLTLKVGPAPDLEGSALACVLKKPSVVAF